MKNLSIAILILAWSCIASANDEWIQLSYTATDEWSVKKGSYQTTVNRNGEEIGVVIGRLRDKANKQISVGKWYVRTTDCKQGFGKLVTLELDGTYRYENDFVFGAGSIASANAQIICAVHLRSIEQANSKGL